MCSGEDVRWVLPHACEHVLPSHTSDECMQGCGHCLAPIVDVRYSRYSILWINNSSEPPSSTPGVTGLQDRRRLIRWSITDMPVQHVKPSALLKKHGHAICCDCGKEASGASGTTALSVRRRRVSARMIIELWVSMLRAF